ncbi:hypothetical protein FGG08_002361 [Glutinoglossum americanum]|uniref:polynucleotide adenylyltransferase n=1 Tax=Glutinoglossum americanum TaxID=1670608 RepID=A0A9P8I9F2_9PEZI|nr:hypothetical protein FGG08_002361 [Glutinoglossum americanum]
MRSTLCCSVISYKPSPALRSVFSPAVYLPCDQRWVATKASQENFAFVDPTLTLRGEGARSVHAQGNPRKPRSGGAEIFPNDLRQTLEAHRLKNRASVIRKLGSEGTPPYIRPKINYAHPPLATDRNGPNAKIQVPSSSQSSRFQCRRGAGALGTSLGLDEVVTRWRTMRGAPVGEYQGVNFSPCPRHDKVYGDPGKGDVVPWLKCVEWNGGDASSRLHGEIKAFEAYVSPTYGEGDLREAVVREIRSHAVVALPGTSLEIFGSYNTGLYTPISDIDLRLTFPGNAKQPNERGPSPTRPAVIRKNHQRLRDFVRYLKTTVDFTDVKLVMAKIPVAVVTHRATGFQLQISAVGETTAHDEYVKTYLAEYPGLKPLYFIIKNILWIRDFTDPYTGGLGSYPLFMAIVAWFRLGKSQGITIWRHNNQALGENLLDFLEFYASFDYYHEGLSIEPPRVLSKRLRPGRPSMLEKEAIARSRIIRAQSKMCIADKIQPYRLYLQDPADPFNDLGSKCFGIKHIRAIFQHTRARLEQDIIQFEQDPRVFEKTGLLRNVIGGRLRGTDFDRSATVLHNLSLRTVQFEQRTTTIAMSDFQMFHALGQAESEKEELANPGSSRQLAAPQFRSPMASSQEGYHQAGPASGANAPSYQYGAQPAQKAYGSPGQPQGYFPPQAVLQPNSPGDGYAGELASQMGGLGLGGEVGGSGPARPHKKKHRHAFHTLETPETSSGAFNGLPASGQVQQQTPGQYMNQEITPAMSQFPAPANPLFNPVNTPSAGAPSAAWGQSPNPPTSIGTSAQGRVDPDQIPSVPHSRDVPAQYYLSHVYPTLENHLPPPGAVPFISHDQGNSSPKFARLTMNNIPATSDALSSTGLPLGLLLQPLAALSPGELPIPVLDFGESGPPRCRRCRAYINPFMTFRSGGNRFVCNMCTFPNEVPPEYFSPTDPSGVRADRETRPELTRGTVDFMVPKEYWAKEPVGLRWLFLIDVCQEAQNKGFLQGFCEGILSAIYGGNESENDASEGKVRGLPPGSKIGIMSFDKEIHFYNLSAGLEQAQMMVVSDIEDPFVPLSEGLFVDPYTSKAVITSLLAQIHSLFSQIKNPEPALLPALNAALSALSSTGGKVVCSLCTLPTWGPGRLFLRDDQKIHNTDSEKKLFTTEHPGFKKTAQKMVESGIGVDFFLAAPGGGYLDIATVGHVSAATGGETFYYPNFLSPRDTPKFSQEIKHTVTRETGYQALMKVRCSNGLQVSSYLGNFLQHTFGADLEFGVIDADKALGVMFSYDGKLDIKLDAHFQSALLYTTANGERRVRCCNIVASVSEGGREAMRFVDQDAVVNLIAKECGHEYSDRRTHDMRMIKSMGAMELSLYLYPRIIPVHNLSEKDGFPGENGHLVMPPAIRASFSRIEEGGVYLVDNGQICLLWIHSQVSPNLLVDLFGEPYTTLPSLDPTNSKLPVLETHLNAQVRNIVQYLSTIRGSKALTIQLARQGLDGAEYEFARLLVEDRNNEAQSYVDWLVHVHRHIQLEARAPPSH